MQTQKMDYFKNQAFNSKSARQIFAFGPSKLVTNVIWSENAYVAWIFDFQQWEKHVFLVGQHMKAGES